MAHALDVSVDVCPRTDGTSSVTLSFDARELNDVGIKQVVRDALSSVQKGMLENTAAMQLLDLDTLDVTADVDTRQVCAVCVAKEVAIKMVPGPETAVRVSGASPAFEAQLTRQALAALEASK